MYRKIEFIMFVLALSAFVMALLTSKFTLIGVGLLSLCIGLNIIKNKIKFK